MSTGLISEGPSRFMKPFSSTNYLQGSKDFLSSNSIVAKFAFLMLVLIIFIMLVKIEIGNNIDIDSTILYSNINNNGVPKTKTPTPTTDCNVTIEKISK